MMKFKFIIILLIVAVIFYCHKLWASNDFSSEIRVSSTQIDQLWFSENSIEFVDQFPFEDESSVCKKVNILADNFKILLDNQEYQNMIKDLPEIKTYQCISTKTNQHCAFLTITPSVTDHQKLDVGGGIFINHKIFAPTKNHDPQEIIFLPLEFQPLEKKCFEENKTSFLKKNFELLKDKIFISKAHAKINNPLTNLNIAIDTDFEFFQYFKDYLIKENSDLFNKEIDLNFSALNLMRNNLIELIGLVNLIYEFDTGIKFKLGNTYFYTNESNQREDDLLNSSLNSIQNHWIKNKSKVKRSLVWYFSGIDQEGSSHLGYKQLSKTGEMITNNEDWLMENNLELEDIENQNFGSNKLWKYSGVICKENAYQLNSIANPSERLSNHQIDFENILIPNLNQLIQYTTKNFGSPYDRWYKKSADLYDELLSINECTDGVDDIPIRRLEFAKPVLREIFKNVSDLNQDILNNNTKNCGAIITDRGNKLPSIKGSIEFGQFPLIANQETKLSFRVNEESNFFMIWEIDDFNFQKITECVPHKACSIDYSFPQAGTFNLRVTAIDQSGELIEHQEKIRIIPNPGKNHVPYVKLNSLGGDVQNGINYYQPNQSFDLLITGNDEDGDILYADIYLNNQLFESRVPLGENNQAIIKVKEISSGEHTLKAIITDLAASNESSFSFGIHDQPVKITSLTDQFHIDESYTFHLEIHEPNGISDIKDLIFKWEFSDKTTIEQRGMIGLGGVNHRFSKLSKLFGKSVTLTITKPDGEGDSKTHVISEGFFSF